MIYTTQSVNNITLGERYALHFVYLIMRLYSTGQHTLHGIIIHPRILFNARGLRPSAIIASEDE